MKLFSILTVLTIIVLPACRTPNNATSDKTGAAASDDGVVNSDDSKINDAKIADDLRNDTDSDRDIDSDIRTPNRQFTQQIQSNETTQGLNSSSDCIEADPMICEIELEIIKQMNEYRKGRGLAALSGSSKLSWVSREWSKTQAKTGRISHLGFPGRRSSQFQSKFNTTPSMTAENVAYSSFGSADAKTIATKLSQMWIKSLGHRRNIIGGHRLIGVGVAKNNSGSYYGTQIFGNND